MAEIQAMIKHGVIGTIIESKQTKTQFFQSNQLDAFST